MWHGFDLNLVRELGVVREMVSLRYQTPTKEWPLIVLDDHEAIFVVREWPNGSITGYTMPLTQPADPPTTP